MAEQSMVERMALKRLELLHIEREYLTQSEFAEYLALERAVLAALRAPTEAMVKTVGEGPVYAREAWPQMIDEATKRTTE